MEWSIFKNIFISILLEAIPFVLLGVVVATLLHMFVSEETIRRLMPKHPALGILFGAGLGILFPICECGMIPVIHRLLKKGMPVYIAVVFLVSGPIINPVVFFSTYMAFRAQPEMVYARMGLAFLVALAVGWFIYRTVKYNPLRAGLADGAHGGVELHEVVEERVEVSGPVTDKPESPLQADEIVDVSETESETETESAESVPDDADQWLLIGDQLDEHFVEKERMIRVDEQKQATKPIVQAQPLVEAPPVVQAQQTIHENTITPPEEATESERPETETQAKPEEPQQAELDILLAPPPSVSPVSEPVLAKWLRKFRTTIPRPRADWLAIFSRWKTAFPKRTNQFLAHTTHEFFEVGKYLVLGCLITAAVHTFMTREMVAGIGDGALSSNFFMMAFAYILSICSTSDAFVASSFAVTFSASSLLAFLVFGPMMDLKTTLMMLSVFQRKFVFTLLGVIFAAVFLGSLLVGWLVF